MAGDIDKFREHMDNNRLNEALTLARQLARTHPADLKVRALLLEVLYAKGEHAAVETELSALSRSPATQAGQAGHAEVQRLRVRFKKRS